ncbi:hypothetical protein C1H46_042529 [Malus baccata]|uniref:RRM domain-containing protein n=1 Tax=Malus baccata TaxID=106549 RepID=A0A540KCV6_MALBA|nr:hypothetical protein C1H46_042529 [Malus baccata]
MYRRRRSESEPNSLQNNKEEETETDGDGVGKMWIRIHVGGLGGTVTEVDLRRMFSSGGTVEGVDIVRTKGRIFAYVDFLPSDDKSLSKLFTTYNGCAWKGGKLRLQKAKEDYLVRLQREWDEDAARLAAAAAPPPDDAHDIKQSLSHSTNTSSNNTKQLRIFFPALRTVKALPFTGTGKHKYSFQRLQTPSLPVHFCDCEEHYVPVPSQPTTTKPSQTQSDNLLCDNGIDEQELNIMTKVMDRLFQTQNETNVDHDGTHQQPHQLHLAATTPPDEDNLIINVVSSNQEKMEKLSEFQEFKSTETQALKGKRSSPSEAQININEPPKKKRKSLPSDSNHQKELEAALSGSKKNLPTQSKVSGKFFGAQPDQPELDRQQVSWSQKSSWRQLVGHRGSSSFSVSHVLTGIAPSADQVETKSGSSEVSLSDSENQDLESNGNSEDQPSEMELVEPTKYVVVSNKLLGRGASSTDQVEPKSVSLEVPLSDSENQDLESNGNSEDLPGDMELVEPQLTKSIGISNEFSGRLASSTDPVEPESGSPEVPLSDSESQDPESNENLEDQPSDMELVEPQPTKSVVVSNKLSGRGSSWCQQSSWTQLVNDNTDTSFSIKQIVPGISSEQQVLPNPEGADPVSSTDGKLMEMVKQDNDKGRSCLGIGREDSVLLGSLEDTIVDNDGAYDPDVGKICDITPKQASAANIEIGETCSFMRTASSLKEWAKIKVALSGSLKKKNAEN